MVRTTMWKNRRVEPTTSSSSPLTSTIGLFAESSPTISTNASWNPSSLTEKLVSSSENIFIKNRTLLLEGNEWQYNDTTGFKTDTEKLTISLYPGKCEVDEEEVPDDISDILGRSQCDQPQVSSGQEIQTKTPLIDIFLNPSAESQEKKALLISKTLKVSKDYFNTVNMTKLYPELFKERF